MENLPNLAVLVVRQIKRGPVLALSGYARVRTGNHDDGVCFGSSFERFGKELVSRTVEVGIIDWMAGLHRRFIDKRFEHSHLLLVKLALPFGNSVFQIFFDRLAFLRRLMPNDGVVGCFKLKLHLFGVPALGVCNLDAFLFRLCADSGKRRNTNAGIRILHRISADRITAELPINGVRTDYGKLSDFLGTNRQDSAVIFQKCDGFSRGFARQVGVFLTAHVFTAEAAV